MKDMPKHTRLHQRSGSKNYYFRARIPTDLLDDYQPRKEICYSLKTVITKKLCKGSGLSLSR